jgi:hydroxymethylbilane synthase
VLLRKKNLPHHPAGALAALPKGATVATSSTRRRAQLHDLRPDLTIVPIRGNVDTRLRKLIEQPDHHATILAAAGLIRLGFEIQSGGGLLDHRPADVQPASSGHLGAILAQCLEPSEMLPCVGQAAIGIEVRSGNPRIAPLLGVLDDPETHQCVAAERAFLAGMGGGCQLAVAALAIIRFGELCLQAVSFLGETPRRAEIRGKPSDAALLGINLARTIQKTTA